MPCWFETVIGEHLRRSLNSMTGMFCAERVIHIPSRAIKVADHIRCLVEGMQKPPADQSLLRLSRVAIGVG